MSENGPGSSIERHRGSEVEVLRERVAAAERELAAIRSARRAPGKPSYATHRYAMCRCGFMEVYAVTRTLFKGDGPKKGRAKRDPGRLENQRCKGGCGNLLGRYAHARAKRAYPHLHERQGFVRAQRALARHQKTLEVAMTSRRGAGTAEKPVIRTSAAALARQAAPADRL